MIDRDEHVQHVDRLLREAMRGPVRAATADCLDVEALAAWSEGSLGAGERARAEAHAATCTRCQAMLAAMIRTEPIVAVASPSPFRKSLMILGPALGAAAAAALWFAVDRPARPTDIAPQAQTMARVEQPTTSGDKEELKARVEPGAPAASSRVAAPGANPVAAPKEIASPRSRELDKSVAVESRTDTDRRKTLDRLADAKAKAPAAPAKPQSGLAETVTITAEAPPVPAAPPATPPPPPASARADQGQVAQAQPKNQSQSANQNANQNANQPLPSPSQNAGQLNQAAPAERRANETAASAVPPPTGGLAGGRGAGQDAAASKRQAYGGRQEATATFNVATSNALIRYRVLDGRTVQRTTDGGTTWTTGYVVLTPAALVAGTAPSPTVCWLVGTSGLVLTTADGLTWREAKLPAPLDIKAITAGDANVATVITLDGRTLTTVNGGSSWSSPR